MFRSNFKRLLILGSAIAMSLGFTSTASADPGKGLRWSDFAWGTASRGQSMRSAPTYAYPSASSSTPATIAIRGPDGVVRNYPVEGGTIVQRQTGLPGQAAQTVTVRDADGVVRTYPVASDAGSNSASVPATRIGGFLRRCR